MNGNKKLEVANFIAGWLEKLSVACYAVGLFETEHMFGGLIGGTICFVIAFSIKMR